MTHTWRVHNLTRNLSDGLITTASYHCTTKHSGEVARTIGDFPLPASDPSDESFIPYEDLTENVVLGWITGSLDTEEVYLKHSSSIADLIEHKITITTGEGTPWE